MYREKIINMELNSMLLIKNQYINITKMGTKAC